MRKLSLIAALIFLSEMCYAGAWSDPVEIDSVFTEGSTDVLGI